jgi:nucleoside-diphosphate-sugar epimerase
MPPTKLHVITGASGQLGSHLVEQLRAAGESVRAFVRPSSNTAFLQTQNVEIVTGNLSDRDTVRRAFAGAAIVFHCAAKVSDWGRWKDFEAEAVTSTRNVVEACRAENVGRLVHVSSISVYGHPDEGEDITEESPLAKNMWLWDYYAQAKILAEKIAWEFGPDVTVIRPSWIYGPRDRVSMPRVIPAILERRVPLIGPGDNLLNIIYVGDVAAGIITAANHPIAKGQAYNLCSKGEVTQAGLTNALTDALGLPRIEKHIPYGLALRFAFLKELFAKMTFRKSPPTITRRAVYLIGRSTRFNIGKAKAHFGWQPTTPIQEGVRRTIEWYFGEKGLPIPNVAGALAGNTAV